MNAHLIDDLVEAFGLRNDAGLARKLGEPPPVISKWRHERLAIGATGILEIHETFGVPVQWIREKIALPAEEK